MYELPNLMSNADKKLLPGHYAIVDWVANNPMSAYMRYPVLVGVNIPPEIMEQIKKGEIKLPEGAGTIQRAFLKIEEVVDFQNLDE